MDLIVSFYGLSGTRACLYGVFKVAGRRPAKDGPTPVGCPWIADWLRKCPYYYDLERVSAYEALEHRLIIDWGKGTLSWHQHLSNKPILELLPEGRLLPVFDDYLEFDLSYRQLAELYLREEAHRDWRAALKTVAGVYLILAETTGHLYVGSAYGTSGLWGRWSEYARSGHGGNKHLIDLIGKDSDYPERFRFSVLQILPQTMTRGEVLDREIRYKRKLGTRATGLNSN